MHMFFGERINIQGENLVQVQPSRRHVRVAMRRDTNAGNVGY